MVLGVVLAIPIGNLAPGPDLPLICFISGAGFVVLGLVFWLKGGEFGEDFVVRTRFKQYDKARQAQADEAILVNAESFQDDEKGIVWVWVVVGATWFIMAIAYFALSTVLYMVLDSVEAWAPWSGTSWESSYLSQIALVRNVCAWFLIIMTIGLVGWALINSARRETGTYGY